MLDSRAELPILPTPQGENVVIITGAGGSGGAAPDACVDNRTVTHVDSADLDEAFRKFIPPFGAAGNPVDITGGEPPSTYRNTVRLGLEDPRVHALILGYWHNHRSPHRCLPPNSSARSSMSSGTRESTAGRGIAVRRRRGRASKDYLFEHGVVAYPYTTEKPVEVLGAKFRCGPRRRSAGRRRPAPALRTTGELREPIRPKTATVFGRRVHDGVYSCRLPRNHRRERSHLPRR